MTAIWPAGPPKLNSATRSQVRTASENETIATGTACVATRVTAAL
jgi:hypothetical protein